MPRQNPLKPPYSLYKKRGPKPWRIGAEDLRDLDLGSRPKVPDIDPYRVDLQDDRAPASPEDTPPPGSTVEPDREPATPLPVPVGSSDSATPPTIAAAALTMLPAAKRLVSSLLTLHTRLTLPFCALAPSKMTAGCSLSLS